MTFPTQEVKNNLGNEEETYFYEEGNRLISALFRYYVYGRGKYGQIDIAQRSMRLVYNESGNSYLFALANMTHLDKDTRTLEFKVKEGLEIGADNALLNRNGLTYKELGAAFYNLPRFSTVVAYGEIKDSYGRQIIRKDEYPIVDNNCFPAGDPRWISFIKYPLYRYITVSSESNTYEWDKDKKTRYLYTQI